MYNRFVFGETRVILFSFFFEVEQVTKSVRNVGNQKKIKAFVILSGF